MIVNLFALTGYGNNALEILLQKGIKIQCLYTRKEPNPYPYYELEQIDELAKRNCIDVQYIDKNCSWSIKNRADVNLIVSYHRLFKKEHLQSAHYNINIHPSLLPSYKGPTPTRWMLFNKEKECGITAHHMTEVVDEGDIIYQKAYALTSNTDAELRKFLAIKIEECVTYILKNFSKWNIIDSPYLESYYGPFDTKKGK
ncbi:formyltransferase family protein [Candidatus Marinarcus aquaticus]|nr:formyltransferase family protein [Candidatus Marinarcus aquaticus]